MSRHRKKLITLLPKQQKPLTVAWLVRAATGDLTIPERAANRRASTEKGTAR